MFLSTDFNCSLEIVVFVFAREFAMLRLYLKHSLSVKILKVYVPTLNIAY